MNGKFRAAALAFALTLVTGCGFDKTWVATDTTRLEAKPSKYDMLVTRNPADRPHKVIGELTVSTRIEPNFTSTSVYDRTIDELRKTAIRKGADAVVEMKTRETDEQGRTRLSVTGICIHYTAPPPATAARG